MATLTMPYIIPLFLGMTFDARYSKPGVDIYDSAYVDSPVVTQFEETKSLYKVTTSMSEVLDTLDISGDLSLKIKSGMMDIQGKGSFIKNQKDNKKSVMVLTTMQYISKVKSFDADAKPRDGWAKEYNVGVLGTHFVSSVTYGAEMIAAAKFVVHNSSDIKEVHGEVEAALGSGGSGIDLVAEGKLENLEKKVKGKANLEISYYGTVPLKSIANSIEGLRTLVNTFSDQIKETDLKEGIPMFVQLTSLADIADIDDRDKFQFLKNKNLLNRLADFEENFDELRQARLDLSTWAKSLPYDLDENHEKEIGSLLKNMTAVLEIHYEVIWDMDLTKGPKQLDRAFDAYNYDGDDVYLRFDKLVRYLKARLEKEIKRDRVASDTYVQWGNNNCTASGTVVLYEGFTFSSSEEGIGGAAQYSCAPRDIETDYDLEDGRIKSHIAGIRYTSLDRNSNPFKGPNAQKILGKGVSCAKCHSPDSAAVAMFAGEDKCPLTWVQMYKGYLMSSRKQYGYTTEYICVDENPSEAYPMDPESASKDSLALTVVYSSGSLPAETYAQGALLHCVVCSMKSNQVTF